MDSYRVIKYVETHYEPGKAFFTDYIERARIEIGYSVPKDRLIIFKTLKPDEWLVNHTSIHDIDGTNVNDLTRAEIEGQKQVFEALNFYVDMCQVVRIRN